jgi:hypothetical protein
VHGFGSEPLGAVIGDLAAFGGNRATAGLVRRRSDPTAPVPARPKRVVKVTYRVADRTVVLTVEGQGSVEVRATYDGGTEAGSYKVGPDGSTPPVPGTANGNGHVLEWDFPRDGGYVLADSYTFEVVGDRAGTPTLADAERVAFVRQDGLNLRIAADQASTSVARLGFGQRLHLLDESGQRGWRKVAVAGPTGYAAGYVAQTGIHRPPDDLIRQDPGLRLFRVRQEQTFWGLVKEVYGIRGDEGAPHQNVNHFINAVRRFNREHAFEVRTGVLDDIGNALVRGRDASDTYLIAGVDLWIPSFPVAAGLDVGSGTVSGEISQFAQAVRQKIEDFAAACQVARAHIPLAVARRAGELAEGLLEGLIQFAIEAVAILASTTALGALLGAAFGGVGAIPGAEIGFEFGLVFLEVWGLYLLIEAILEVAGGVLTRLGEFVTIAWQANGRRDQIELAGRTLADGVGLLVAGILLAIVAFAIKGGAEALGKTRFAGKLGTTRLARWLADRVRGRTISGDDLPPAVRPLEVVLGADELREVAARIESAEPGLLARGGPELADLVRLIRQDRAATIGLLREDAGAVLRHLRSAPFGTADELGRAIRRGAGRHGPLPGYETMDKPPIQRRAELADGWPGVLKKDRADLSTKVTSPSQKPLTVSTSWDTASGTLTLESAFTHPDIEIVPKAPLLVERAGQRGCPAPIYFTLQQMRAAKIPYGATADAGGVQKVVLNQIQNMETVAHLEWLNRRYRGAEPADLVPNTAIYRYAETIIQQAGYQIEKVAVNLTGEIREAAGELTKHYAQDWRARELRGMTPDGVKAEHQGILNRYGLSAQDEVLHSFAIELTVKPARGAQR